MACETGSSADGVGDRGEAVRPVLAVAGDESDATVFDERENAVAVEFELVEPVLARGARVGERGELRRERCRLRGIASTGEVGEVGLPALSGLSSLLFLASPF